MTPSSIAAQSPVTVQSMPRQPIGSERMPTDQRRQNRSDPTDGEHQGERLGRRPSGHQVGDDGTADDHPAGAGQALDQPGPTRTSRVGAAARHGAGQHADGGADDQRPPSAEAVRQRSHQQLAERQPGQEGGQGELDARSRRRRARRRAPGSQADRGRSPPAPPRPATPAPAAAASRDRRGRRRLACQTFLTRGGRHNMSQTRPPQPRTRDPHASDRHT